MSDIIYYKNGEETFRISPPTPGTKCPETKLEIKMTETDISKVLIEGDYATIMGVKYKRVKEQEFTLELTLDELHMLDKYVEYCEETKEFFDKLKDAYPKQKSPIEEAYKDWCGEYPSGSPSEDAKWGAFLAGYQVTQPKAVPVDDPPEYDEIEHDISENVENKTIRQVIDRWWMDTFTSKNMWSVNECIDDLADQIEFWILRNKKEVSVEEQSKPMDEVVNRLVKKYQAQKLFNRLVDELGYDFDACNDIVDLVEDWILDEQSSAGSQNVNTELLVDGFNDAIRKMKEMLR
jgi:hypothetical protein